MIVAPTAKSRKAGNGRFLIQIKSERNKAPNCVICSIAAPSLGRAADERNQCLRAVVAGIGDPGGNEKSADSCDVRCPESTIPATTCVLGAHASNRRLRGKPCARRFVI